MKLKSNYNMLIGVGGIFFAMLHIILGTIEYQYRPRNYLFFLILYGIAVVVITVFSVWFKKYSGKSGVVFGCLMPFISLIYEISLFFFFDSSIDYLSYSILYLVALFGSAFISSAVIFFVYCTRLWLRILGILATVGSLHIFAIILFASWFGSSLGSNTLVDTIYSPKKTYQVWVISSDQGILGGDTMINIQNIKTKINFLTGTIIGQRERIWTGDWGKEPELKWKDENTLLINGVTYCVEINQ